MTIININKIVLGGAQFFGLRLFVIMLIKIKVLG
ncbi:hypothetical protein ACUY4R_002952 [Kosakonia sp. BK9b]